MKIRDVTAQELSRDHDDDEERHRRHEEREVDRQHQRDRERLCLPVEEWPDEQRRGFESELEEQLRDRLMKLVDLQHSLGAMAETVRESMTQMAEAQRTLGPLGLVNPFRPEVDTPEERA